MAIAGLIAQTPMGAYIDKTKHKRTLLVAAAIVVILSTLVIIWHPTFYSILTAKIFMGVAALSTLISGEIVAHYSYSAAFYFLAAVAVVALIIFMLFVPETKPKNV